MNVTIIRGLGATFVVALVAAASQACAFHSGGVAECGGCHSMHSPDPAGSALLVGTTHSSTCLECHAQAGRSSYHVKTPTADMAAGVPPVNLTPGGDFGWLEKDYVFVVSGSTVHEPGREHGHNVVAPDFGLSADPSNATSPGGSFAAAELSCVSCHDMHGQYRRLSSGSVVRGGYYGQLGGAFGATAPIVGSGSYSTSTNPIAGQAVGVYRLLWGAGATVGPVTFGGVPAAVAPATYNRSEVTSQTRVSYGVGSRDGFENWGTWCATCHDGMHSRGAGVHPIDRQVGGNRLVYNNYVSSGDLSADFTGDHAAQGPYLSLVPILKNDQGWAALRVYAAAGATTSTELSGADPQDNVSCLSCHRAHASGFPFMLRWQMEGEFITVADTLAEGYQAIWPAIDNGAPPEFARGRTELEQRTAYYERPAAAFGIYQRSLCNKCHGHD